jgi:hypothetical protein
MFVKCNGRHFFGTAILTSQALSPAKPAVSIIKLSVIVIWLDVCFFINHACKGFILDVLLWLIGQQCR